jgi:hypothetical protein
MDKDKFKAFMGFTKVPAMAQEAVLKASAKLEAEAQQIRVLQHTPGWKLLDEFFRAEREELLVCKKEDLDRVQLEIEVIDKLYNFMNKTVLRDA